MAIETWTRELRYLKVKLEACNNELDVGGERKRSGRDDPVVSDLSHHWCMMMIKKRRAK